MKILMYRKGETYITEIFKNDLHGYSDSKIYDYLENKFGKFDGWDRYDGRNGIKKRFGVNKH